MTSMSTRVRCPQLGAFLALAAHHAAMFISSGSCEAAAKYAGSSALRLSTRVLLLRNEHLCQLVHLLTGRLDGGDAPRVVHLRQVKERDERREQAP